MWITSISYEDILSANQMSFLRWVNRAEQGKSYQKMIGDIIGKGEKKEKTDGLRNLENKSRRKSKKGMTQAPKRVHNQSVIQ